MPFAAFFVAVCLLLCIPDRTRKASLCLLLGAAAGLAAARHTNARLEQTLEKYAGQTVALTAEVESVSASYYPGIVDAVLRVERVNGRAAEFRVECDTLPVCEAGERVEGRFALEAPEPADRTTLFADGAALLAKEPQAFARLGQGSSFRARTSRLQKRLSTSLRGEMNEDAGGVLAAMTVGDRHYLSSALRSTYRGAGLSHVLVVSGMHVSILCGDVFGSVFGRRRRERSYRSRRVKALFTAFLALLLAGVTGFTPSVCRAAVAVWVSALGVWVYGASDALTSLAAAGILMTARNSYAVCDIGFELSFAAVLGTLAGAELSRHLHALFAAHATRKKKPSVLQRILRHVRSSLTETVCIGVCASAATFPVLVLRGLSVSIYAVLSGAAVLWMVKPMMLLSLGTAFAGLVPVAGPLYLLLGKAAEALTGLLNRWAVWVSAKPGAGLYFDTNYAALVCPAADGSVRAGTSLEGTAAGGCAGPSADGSPCHWRRQCPVPGCGAHRPCGQCQQPGGGGQPESHSRGAVPGWGIHSAGVGKPAGPPGRDHGGTAGRSASGPGKCLHAACPDDVPSGSAAGGKRRHPTDVDRSSGDPAYPVRLPCAADHRGAAVRDRERNGDAGRTGPGAVAAGISGKAGGRAMGTAAEPE